MAIGYTPQTWVNGSAPALSAANLQTMDNGINAACDAVDTLIINDGTDNPGASTGEKIVSALTKAGYSLDPATGSDNLDNIADGSSYHRVEAAQADIINAANSIWTTSGTGGSDGNGGQPPAPKPKAYSSASIGEVTRIATDGVGDVYLPPNGKWFYFIGYISGATAADCGIGTGSSKVRSLGSNVGYVGFGWRIE